MNSGRDVVNCKRTVDSRISCIYVIVQSDPRRRVKRCFIDVFQFSVNSSCRNLGRAEQRGFIGQKQKSSVGMYKLNHSELGWRAALNKIVSLPTGQ